MAEQPADREHRLALLQGEARMGMAEIVKPDIFQPRLGAQHPPEAVEPRRAERPVPARGREDPAGLTFERTENPSGGIRQPDGSGPGLRITQEEVAVPVVGPAERHDLALAAAGEQQETDGSDFQGPVLRVAGQRPCQSAHLILGQKALAPLAAIAPDVSTRVGALRPQPHRLGFPHNQGKDRHRPVGSRRRRR